MTSAQNSWGGVDNRAPSVTGASDPGSVAVQALQPFRGPFQRWPRITDALLGVLAFFLTLAMWSSNATSGELGKSMSGALLILAIVASAALFWRRRYPVQVHGLVLCCLVLAVLSPLNDGVVAMAFSLYSLGRYAANDRISTLGMLLAILLAAIDMFVINNAGFSSLFTLMMMGALWYVGRRLRFRGEYLRLLEERAQYLEQRKNREAQLAVTEERGRIARELHDIVAHQLSLMTVQAGAAKTVGQSDPIAAMEAMEAVEGAGRQALREMRHLLHVLRRDENDSSLVPQPGCADLPSLIAEVNATGVAVQLQTGGRLSGLPARVDLSVYRIVQEALTNVLKHAGKHVSVTVTVASSAEGVEVSICDSGSGPGETSGRGYGIAGMRERAEMLGGWLRTGPGSNGGFEVSALLPCDGSRS
jgi:signal transduction histidine kinase